MAVTISNVGARSLSMQYGKISAGGWDIGNQINVGYYNDATSYAMQLRFRLDKPCSDITLVVQGASGSGGTYYLKLSDKEWDEELMTRFFTQGNEPYDAAVSIGWNGYSYWGSKKIEGDFPADTDLYIYVFNYSASYNTKTLFGLYDSDRYSKVTDATEIQRWDVIYANGDELITDEKIYGEALTLRGVSFYRNGYTQIGWSTSEGGEITHKLGESYTADEALTLYPVWGIAPGVVLWLLIKRAVGRR